MLLVNLTDDNSSPLVGHDVYLKDGRVILDTLTTNEYGQVSFSLNSLAAGIYNNIYVEFLENRAYAGAILPVCVVVNKVKTVLESENVSTFYEEGKIIAKLSDEFGNPLANSDVYIIGC